MIQNQAYYRFADNLLQKSQESWETKKQGFGIILFSSKYLKILKT